MTACHIATCLIRVMLTLREERDAAQQQEGAEGRKKADKAGPNFNSQKALRMPHGVSQ